VTDGTVCPVCLSVSRLSQTDRTGRLAIFTVPSCFRETLTHTLLLLLLLFTIIITNALIKVTSCDNIYLTWQNSVPKITQNSYCTLCALKHTILGPGKILIYFKYDDITCYWILKLTLTLTLTDTGGAVLTLMLGYRSLYITCKKRIAPIK